MILAAFIVAALAGFVIAKQWVERPVRALQSAAEEMARGDLKVRPPRASIPEARALSAQFVAMAEALEQRLHQKDVLLKEVNHRVKNSLQLVSSVLSLHRAGIEDEKSAAPFRRGRGESGHGRARAPAPLSRRRRRIDRLRRVP